MRHARAPAGEALIGSIYEAALDQGRWPGVLDQVRKRIGASSALLFTPELPPGDGVWVGLIFTAQAAQAYSEHFFERDVWYHAARRRGWLRHKSIFYSDELVPAPAYARSEIYNDLLREFDMFHGCWSVTSDRAPRSVPLTAFGFYRDQKADPITPTEALPLRHLAAHLQRAMEIHWRLKAPGAQGVSGLALLEHLPSAVLLLSETGRVIHVNRRAEALLTEADGLKVWRRRLEASDAAAGRVLARLIGRCVATGMLQGSSEGGQDFSAGGALPVPRPSGRRAWQVLVTPLPIEGGQPGWAGTSAPHDPRVAAERVCAAVFIADPEAPALVPVHLLQTWFGLTAGEARVALDVANGYSAEEIAQRAGLAWHTVRTHLKALYEKMGVKRQNELAKKVLTCPGMALAMEKEDR